MTSRNNRAAALLLTAVLIGCSTPPPDRSSSRTALIAYRDFVTFERTSTADAVVLTSPRVDVPAWNELIVSWNASCPGEKSMLVEARAFHGTNATRFYTMGEWSESAARQSVRGQNDADAAVHTDTLVCKRPMQAAQVRVTLRGSAHPGNLKFLSLAFLNSATPVVVTRTNHRAWETTLNVPQRSQLEYPDGDGWCSPASISMMLGYWKEELRRPEMDVPVPEVAKAVSDPNWPGTGNWPFNTAFAGTFAGMRAFVARLDELAQVEDCVAAGIPVALSVSFDLLNGKPRDEGNGHLVVAVGFTESGDVVANDPWPNPKRENSVRKIFPRERVIRAWQRSKQTAYLVYPERLRHKPNWLP